MRVCVCVPVRFVCFLYFVLSFGGFWGGVCCLFWGFVWLFVFVLLGGGGFRSVFVCCVVLGRGLVGGLFVDDFVFIVVVVVDWDVAFLGVLLWGVLVLLFVFVFVFLFFFFFCCIYRKITFFTS